MHKTLRALRTYRRKLRRRRRQLKEAQRGWVTTGNRKFARVAKQDASGAQYLSRLVAKLMRRKERIEVANREGLDWAFGTVSAEAMLANGKTFACRYLSHDHSKNLTAIEAINYSRAGIDLVVVWEDGTGGSTKGYHQGYSDANAALAQARLLGKPHQAPIFFAVDFDAAGPEIEKYFRGVASSLGTHAGIYAGLDAVEYILDRKIVPWAWQTYAWSDHKWDRRAALKQVLISLPGEELEIDGVHVDYNKSVTAYFGQWKSSLA